MLRRGELINMQHNNAGITTRILSLLIITTVAAGIGAAWGAPAGLSLSRPVSLAIEDSRSVTLPVGRSTLLNFQRMKRVEVIEPELVDVVVASLNDLSIYAKKAGDTTVYVWDRTGIHQVEVTVTAPSEAEELIQDLRKVLGNRLTYTAAGDRTVVIEGVLSPEEGERARSIIAASAREGLQIVDLIRAEGDGLTPAVALAKALEQVLGPKLQYVVWNNNTVLVQGRVGDQTELERARRLLTAATGRGVTVIDLLEFQESAATAPVEDIQRAVGEKFRVWQIQGKTVAVEGEVGSAAELADLGRILGAFQQQANVINLVRVVEPQADINQVIAVLQELLGNRFTIRPLQHEGIIVEGTVPNPDELARIREIIAQYPTPYRVMDLLRIAQPERMQVIVHVKVLDINSGDLKRIGVNWGQLSIKDNEVTFVDQPWLMFAEGGVNNVFTLGAQIEALRQQNKARVLSEPNIMVDDGGKASVLVGGEIPVPIAQPGGGGVSSITIEWKAYGVELVVEPLILEGGKRIHLKVAPEVSSLDFGNAITLNGFVLPALRSRKAETTVTVGNNECLLLAGLLQKEETKSLRKIPLLGDLPIIGKLFQRKEFQVGESELVIMVTPEIVDKTGGTAAAAGATMAAPGGGAAGGTQAGTQYAPARAGN